MPKGAFSRAFRCKNDQHVAHGDDGFNKQDDADPARDTPRHERQYGQSRRDVTNTLEAKPPGDVGTVFRKRQAETACRGPRAHDILGADRDNRESHEQPEANASHPPTLATKDNLASLGI